MTNMYQRRFQAYGPYDIDRIPQVKKLDEDTRIAMKAVAAVFPFRVNGYVLDELIDWDHIPEDPIFQLTFPQIGMLEPADYREMAELVRGGAPRHEIVEAARRIQWKLNPHPAGQKRLNVPSLDGESLVGMQHKYRETVLFFPSQGQTCHAYCTYCFRWAQFVGIENLKFAERDPERLVRYLKKHREVSSVLFTGGDPLIMRTKVLRRFIEPLLDGELEHVESIRIGTKALAYWPYRVTGDSDADDLLRLFEEVSKAGKHLALMAHYSHSRELEPPVAQEALRRVIGTGAVVRTQAPLIRHVNDDPAVWLEMWRRQLRLDAVPYYMFVERDTGARNYFEVPLARALEIFQKAYRYTSGLCRTVRGPSMSATPGKVLIDGVAEIDGERVFVLKMLQGRNPRWVNQVFFARFDPEACWLDELEPALGEREFFFEAELREMARRGNVQVWLESDEARHLAESGPSAVVRLTF